MARWFSTLCFVLAMMSVCEAILPVRRDDRPGAEAIASKSNRLQPTAALDYRRNGSLQCLCMEESCLPLYCPKGALMSPLPDVRNCTPAERRTAKMFPPRNDPRTLEGRPGHHHRTRDNLVFLWDPCRGIDKYQLRPEENPDDEYKLLGNGSIYLPIAEKTIDFTSYCFGFVGDTPIYIIVLCWEDVNEHLVANITLVCKIISIPFLLATYTVYSIIPELRNMHGATLRGYVASLIVAYSTEPIMHFQLEHGHNNSLCKSLVTVVYFSLLASFFWLNVMCFDIWWNFGGYSHQSNINRWDLKKYIIYSVYAWGSASLITGASLVMDLVPNIPKSFVRPGFGVKNCWFHDKTAEATYLYGPVGFTIVCNICFFISTTMRIMKSKKDTAHHFDGAESRRHENVANKRFNIYVNLSLVMGMHWSTAIIKWFCNNRPKYLWYVTSTTNNLQGVIIFLIFVWKDKIKRLLLKRLGYRDASGSYMVTPVRPKKDRKSMVVFYDYDT